MYAELQQAICDYLETEEDTYGLPIIRDDPPDTDKDVDEKLKREGICLIVGKPRQTGRPGSEVMVSVPLMLPHNPEVNENGENGLNRTPEQCIADLQYTLDRYQPEAFWTPFNARPFDSKDPEFAMCAWGVMLETKTLIAREFAILIDHNGNGISDHEYTVFTTTNRGKAY